MWQAVIKILCWKFILSYIYTRYCSWSEFDKIIGKNTWVPFLSGHSVYYLVFVRIVICCITWRFVNPSRFESSMWRVAFCIMWYCLSLSKLDRVIHHVEICWNCLSDTFLCRMLCSHCNWGMLFLNISVHNVSVFLFAEKFDLYNKILCMKHFYRLVVFRWFSFLGCLQCFNAVDWVAGRVFYETVLCPSVCDVCLSEHWPTAAYSLL